MSHYKVTSMWEINSVEKNAPDFMSSHLTEQQKPQHCETGNPFTEDYYLKDKVCGADACLYVLELLQHSENCNELWLCFKINTKTSFKSRPNQNQSSIKPYQWRQSAYKNYRGNNESINNQHNWLITQSYFLIFSIQIPILTAELCALADLGWQSNTSAENKYINK